MAKKSLPSINSKLSPSTGKRVTYRPTNKRKVWRFLKAHPTKQYCVACLTQLASITNNSQVWQKCDALATEGKIVQYYSVCSCCRAPRKCNQISSGYCIYRNGNTIIIPSIQDNDEFWKVLQAAIRKGKKPEGLIFLGGGTIPIPAWFRDWCRSQGITITILAPKKKCSQNSSGPRVDNGSIYPNGGTIIIPSVQDTDEFWRDLQEGIQREILNGQKPGEIIFMGGGTIPIPDWFRDWCRSQGIIITILDPKKIETDSLDEIEIDPLKD